MLRKRSRELVLTVGMVPLVLLLLALSGLEERELARRQLGVYFDVEGDDLHVTQVAAGSAADQAGLRGGDRIVALDATTLEGLDHLDRALDEHPTGTPLRLTLERNGATVVVELVPGGPFPLFELAVTVVTVLCYLLIGPLASIKRPGYLRAQLLLYLTMAVALELAIPGRRVATEAWLIAGLLLNGIQMGVELHLASVIPERQRWLDRAPWAIPAFYWFGLGATALVAAMIGLDGLGANPLPWSGFEVYEGAYGTVILSLWALGVLWLLGYQAFTYPEPKGRQQAGIVAAGVLPWAALQLLSISPLYDPLVPIEWEDVVWNVALLCYPLSVLVILLWETANQERIVLDLTEKVQRVRSVAEISRIVSLDLHASFHPKSTHVFYRQRHSRDLTLGHSTGIQLREEVIPQNSPLLRLVEGYGKPVDYPQDLLGLPPNEMEWLERLEARLIVPLTGRDQRLLGLLVLGQKKSEEPYTPHDRKLLQALTNQIALVYENARLEDRVAQSQRVQREVLTRLGEEELELVRECPECGRCYDAGDDECVADGAELDQSLPVERLIGGRYRLEQRVDRGGMGAIYEATDLHLDRPVAVKILVGSMVTDQVVRRFDSEARLTASLRHPNIVTVHDYGTTNTGIPFLVMELLRGRTLKSTFDEHPAPALIAEWIDQTCEGLKAAHLAEIIHRDLKPANIFIARRDDGGEVVKLLDFGVAKLRSTALAEHGDLTAPGMLVGTFRYMSPEQLRGDDADERSDVFSLALVTAEAVGGAHPFPGDSPADVLRAIVEGPGEAMIASFGSERLRQVLLRSLAAEPGDRHPTVDELQRALVPALRSFAAGDVSATRGETT